MWFKVPQCRGNWQRTEPASLRRNQLKNTSSKIKKLLCPYCRGVSHYQRAGQPDPAADQPAVLYLLQTTATRIRLSRIPAGSTRFRRQAAGVVVAVWVIVLLLSTQVAVNGQQPSGINKPPAASRPARHFKS